MRSNGLGCPALGFGYKAVYFCLWAFNLGVLFLTLFLTPLFEAVINTAREGEN